MSSGRSGSGYLNHTAPHMELGDCLSSVENVAEKLITGHCPFNKHLYYMGLLGKPICIACGMEGGMEDESAFHLLCNCPSLISLKMSTFTKPILSVVEYERASASALLRFALARSRFTVTS
jgi:hypothetical protein